MVTNVTAQAIDFTCDRRDCSIGLQGHRDSRLVFRHIRVKRLPQLPCEFTVEMEAVVIGRMGLPVCIRCKRWAWDRSTGLLQRRRACLI